MSGGCGKTRLALRIASAAAAQDPDGVWWIDLAGLDDPSLVPEALAAVLGIPESPMEPITDTVVRYLAARRVLVVLDNCEHLIHACASLAVRLLEGCSAITVLATSRERLGVLGETTWPVPPLRLPSDTDVTTCESVRLFVERARAWRPGFTVTEVSAPTIAEICTQLDGIPLAIELAAARTRVLAVEQISAGLADRFRLLTGGSRTALPRQRTMESSVGWSYDLLDERERAVFCRLAAFAGSFTLEAAEAVCAAGDIPVPQVLDLLTGLVDRSLVHVVLDAAPEARYRLLETIRDYAHKKLTDAGEAEATRDRHLDFCVSFAERAAAGLQGPDLVEWLSRGDGELPNLRVALDWAARSHPERGVRLVGLLLLYWFARSDLGVGRTRLAAVVDAGGDDGIDRAHGLIALCWIAYRAGDMARARRFADEAIAIGRRLGDAPTLGGALAYRGVVRFWGEADPSGGWADFQEADALLRQTDDVLFRALNLGWFGQSLFDSSDAPRARAVLDEGVTLTGATRALHARCPCLLGASLVDTFEGRLDAAAAHAGEVLPLAQEIGDHYSEILARMSGAFLGLFAGRYHDARDHCEAGLATAIENRSPNGEAFMRLALGWVAYAEGDADRAAAELESAFRILAPLMPRMAAMCRALEATAVLAQSRHREAGRYADEALRLGQENDSVIATECALGAKAALARLDGDPHRAEDLLHDQLELECRFGHRPFICDTLEALAGVIAEQGRFEEAARLLGAAQAGRDAIGYVRFHVLQSVHQVDTSLVRDRLGADAFDRAWADGAALALDDAVAYSRRGRGHRKRPAHGWDSLTPAELQVVDLVAQGLTNPQIGKRLFDLTPYGQGPPCSRLCQAGRVDPRRARRHRHTAERGRPRVRASASGAVGEMKSSPSHHRLRARHSCGPLPNSRLIVMARH